jgi:hypothetical protein
MRTARVLAIALVMSAWASLPAAADPISDPSAVGQPNGTFQMALFDMGGLPFLLTSGPSYVQLPPHRKLRGGSGANDEDDASGPFINNFVSSFPFGSSGSSGGSGETGGSGASGGTGGSGSENPSGEFPGDESEDPPGGSGDDIDIDVPGGGGQTRVPEPSLLLLLGPAGALWLRKRSGR